MCMRTVRSWTVQRRNTLTALFTARSLPAIWRWSSSVGLRILMGTNRVSFYHCVTSCTTGSYFICMTALRFVCVGYTASKLVTRETNKMSILHLYMVLLPAV